MFGEQQVIVMVVWQQPGIVFKHPVPVALAAFNDATPERFACATCAGELNAPT